MSRQPTTNPPKTIDQQLYEACASGKTGEVRKLLAQPTVYPNSAHEFGQTSFYIACENGQTEVVRLLLNDVRVDVNRVNNNGQTPFYIACKMGYVDIAELLLNDERIDVNKVNSNSQTPFYIACEIGHVNLVNFLLNDERIDPNKGPSSFKTPFNIACDNGHVDVVKILLNDQRVDINKPISGGGTPFYAACESKHTEIVKLLLNEVEETTKDFFLACRNGKIEIVQYILASGREVDLKDKNNQGDTVIDITRKQIGPIEQQQQHLREQQSRMPGHRFDFASHEIKKKQYIEIIELLESFERNPTETRTKLRNQLGLPDINFFDGNRRERRKIVEEKKVVGEERKNQGPKANPKVPEYEIEYNNELFILQMVANSLPELEIAIKSKLKLEQSEKIRLSFKRKGKLIVLDDLEFLKEGMTVKVSIISQLKPNPGNQIEHFQLKNWNEVVFLSQGANDEYRIEIDPDEIPLQIKNQIVQLMQKSSKLETCLRSRLTPSNIIFQIDFVSRNRADKVFEQIVDILESN